MYLYSENMFNVTYSVDMVRFKTYISFSDFFEIEFRFKTCWSNYVKKMYTSSRCEQFFYNYNIEIDEGISFWFGFLHNSEKRSDSIENYNFTIEFNPNKLKDCKLIEYFFKFGREWYIRRIDIACDVPISILDIVYDKGSKRNVKVFSQGFDDKTIYLGVGNKRVKIYNKKRESNLDIAGDLTRIETSIEYDDYPFKNIRTFKIEDDVFPCLFVNKYIYSLKDYEDKTLLAIIYAIQNGFNIDMLTRRYKEKIKGLVEGGNRIIFRGRPATNVFRKTVYFYTHGCINIPM